MKSGINILQNIEVSLLAGETRRAVIDIGSNSIKLLIADIDQVGVVVPLIEKSCQTRLAEGTDASGKFSQNALRESLRVLREYIDLCIRKGVEKPLIFATSAARGVSAEEFSLLSLPIFDEYGLKIQIITSDQEALWAFKGVCTDAAFTNKILFLTDVGGGSAQFTIGKDGKYVWSRSYPLGAVRLLEKYPFSDPPTLEEKNDLILQISESITHLRQEIESDISIKNLLPNFDLRNLQWIGTGGAATILSSLNLGLVDFDRNKLENSVVTAEELQKWGDKLWGVSLEERKNFPGLPSCRADIMLPGVAIYLAIMQVFSFSSIRISARGGRYGALSDERFF